MKRYQARSSVALALTLCGTLGFVLRTAAEQPSVPDVQTLGPQIGSRVPDFTLSDQGGQPRSLQSLMGPKGVMLVFLRSADW